MKKDRPKLNALILQYLRDESLEGTQMNGRSLKQRQILHYHGMSCIRLKHSSRQNQQQRWQQGQLTNRCKKDPMTQFSLTKIGSVIPSKLTQWLTSHSWPKLSSSLSTAVNGMWNKQMNISRILVLRNHWSCNTKQWINWIIHAFSIGE